MIHCIVDIGKAYNIVGLGPFYDFVRGVAGYTERDLTLPQSLSSGGWRAIQKGT